MSNVVPGWLVVVVAELSLVSALGCGGAATPPATLSNAAAAGGQPSPPAGALFAITRDAIGPINAKTPANLAALRDLLGPDGYAVRAVHNAGLEYHVTLGDELLFYVIPNDDGSLFNVHATSAKVAIPAHPRWQITAPFSGDEVLTHCECWGEHPVCFKEGDHVAVAFQRACDGLDDARMRKVLVGVKLQRAIWSPTAFRPDDEGALGGASYGGDAYGGGDPCGWDDP